MPEINNLYKEHKNDVEVVGIQLVGLDSVDDGKNFVKDTSISYAVGSDPDGSISVAYGVSGFPTTFFIDSFRIIRFCDSTTVPQSMTGW